MLKNDPNIGIGAVDCDIDRNICSKYGVNGFPALKAVVAGKGKSYNGPRETDAIKEFITHIAANRGTKGGSAKCAPGLFKSKMKDSVVSLCEEHFPDDKAKNDWLVIFYNEKDKNAAGLRQVANAVSSAMGNDPPDINKRNKQQKKKRDRLTELNAKYDLGITLPAKGPFGMDALVKVGSVCCDCNEDGVAFCGSSLRIGEEDIKPPQAFWVSKGSRTLLKDVQVTEDSLVVTILQKLGYASAKEGKTDL